MIKAKKLTREGIVRWATGRGWKQDKYGNMQKKIGDKQYRLKLSSIAVRQEVKVHYDDGTSGWVRLNSGYYNDLSIDYTNSEGRLLGMRW